MLVKRCVVGFFFDNKYVKVSLSISSQDDPTESVAAKIGHCFQIEKSVLKEIVMAGVFPFTIQ
jgi:hypothetical protein